MRKKPTPGQEKPGVKKRFLHGTDLLTIILLCSAELFIR